MRDGGTVTNRIVGTMNNIEASATTGNIYLWNKGALTVGGVPGDGSQFALYAPAGLINVQTSSPLEISQNILADGSITKQAGTAAAIGRQSHCRCRDHDSVADRHRSRSRQQHLDRRGRRRRPAGGRHRRHARWPALRYRLHRGRADRRDGEFRRQYAWPVDLDDAGAGEYQLERAWRPATRFSSPALPAARRRISRPATTI